MPTVLCYGDSLTYGSRPDAMGRHPAQDRWPNALAAGLAAGSEPEVTVLAEGLGGRSTAFDLFHDAVDRNGARILPTLLQSHAPLDLVAIMLGTNDVMHLGAPARQARRGMQRLAEIVLRHPYPYGLAAPKLLIIAPPLLAPAPDGRVTAQDMAHAAGLAPAYRGLAAEVGAGFFDAATVAQPSPEDGIHLDAATTRALGTALVPVVKRMLGRI